jgi:hypothetical protein
MDPEVLAHRDRSAAPLDVVEARDLPLRFVIHPITSVQLGSLRIVDRNGWEARRVISLRHAVTQAYRRESVKVDREQAGS